MGLATDSSQHHCIYQNRDCTVNAPFFFVDAECRKSADKAAAKKKRETKQSRSDTTANATKSYAVLFTNKPMDSKVQSLKRKKGRNSLKLLNEEKQHFCYVTY